MQSDIAVSTEYLESICEWLEKWVKQEDSWTIPQFLKDHGLGWSYFKAMVDMCPLLQNTFERITAVLHSKWLLHAMIRKDLSPHMQKILMRYLRIYDNHAYEVETEARKEIAKHTKLSIINYAAEDYSKERLKGLYKSLYDDNVNKRRNRKTSKRV